MSNKMDKKEDFDRKKSNDSDAISLFYEGDSFRSDGSGKRSYDSISSLDEYLAKPKRLRATLDADNDGAFEMSESFRNQPTDERINTLFEYVQNTKLEYAPNLCNEIVEHGRKQELPRFMEVAKTFPTNVQPLVYDHVFRALWHADGAVYSTALKELTNIVHSVGYTSEKCIDYIVRKILATNNDNLSAFYDELKYIHKSGYKFDVMQMNSLMDHCIKNFDLNFHQFVLDILNKFSRPVLDMVNQELLKRFAERRMENVRQQRRLGLSRKM
ncbi:uncharacterized protein LOC116347154 [Contarinia nasturtii]|uniref:uncharacterized protein LOC116347154 n=1 Tax=Contarinia nasturtii TaxID=265458 RepID=UPI0012D38085|nr:uncharacterized protein LOC116347154 [Contarinia nasturtii]